MTYTTIDALRESLATPSHKVRTPEYVAKMMHTVPTTTVVDREKFILERCQGKRVLEFGASGKLHVAIKATASEYLGVDRNAGDKVIAFDLDDVSAAKWPLPAIGVPPDVIVCGEILEHLSNPGYFLQRLKAQFDGVPAIVSAPNAMCEPAAIHIRDGVENVNKDHVAWYSWKTLTTLLERHGYAVEQFHWYNGKPLIAEGLIVVAR